ncbi:unnamed protein product [Arabidopsis halleri]
MVLQLHEEKQNQRSCVSGSLFGLFSVQILFLKEDGLTSGLIIQI